MSSDESKSKFHLIVEWAKTYSIHLLLVSILIEVSVCLVFGRGSTGKDIVAGAYQSSLIALMTLLGIIQFIVLTVICLYKLILKNRKWGIVTAIVGYLAFAPFILLFGFFGLSPLVHSALYWPVILDKTFSPDAASEAVLYKLSLSPGIAVAVRPAFAYREYVIAIEGDAFRKIVYVHGFDEDKDLGCKAAPKVRWRDNQTLLVQRSKETQQIIVGNQRVTSICKGLLFRHPNF